MPKSHVEIQRALLISTKQGLPFVCLISFCWLFTNVTTGTDAGSAQASSTYSIQAALDVAKGQTLRLPPGTHVLSEPIVVSHSGAGLCGPARLVLSDPNVSFVEMHHMHGVSLKDLTLVRLEGAQDALAPAVLAQDCQFLRLEGVTVLDTRCPAAAIRIEQCRHVDVLHCQVRNYMTLTVDDRTRSPHYGYAFNCIDGTGILLSACRDVLVQGNRIIEENLRPTPEVKRQHRLGEFVKRAAQKGSIISQATWDAGYVNNWHQGSALVITGPTSSAHIRLIGNHVENAAQGIDIHADYVTVNANTVVNAFMGMKAMHGSKHVIMSNNQFIRNDLWSIGLMPGTASHAAAPATGERDSQAANTDGGSIIANNIITDFGYGDSHWIWDPQRYTCAPILLDRGQEPDDPPLSDVVISGNVVYNTGQDGIIKEGRAIVEAPRYRYAVYVSDGAKAPRGLQFSNNLFHPGTLGISNAMLKPTFTLKPLWKTQVDPRWRAGANPGHAEDGITAEFVEFSHDGRWLVTANGLGQAFVINARTGEIARRFTYITEQDIAGRTEFDISGGRTKGLEVECGAFTPDGRYLVLGGNLNGVKVFDLHSGSLWRHIEVDEEVDGLGISPDGRFLAHAARLCAQVRGLPGCDPVAQVKHPNHRGVINSIHFTADASLMATAGNDGQVVITRTRDWSFVNAGVIPEPSSIKSVRFSPDGSLVAAGYGGGDLAVFRTSNMSLVKQISLFYVEAVAWTADGALLLAGGRDEKGCLQVFRTGDWQRVATPQVQADQANVEYIAVRGRHIAVAGEDAHVHLFEMSP